MTREYYTWGKPIARSRHNNPRVKALLAAIPKRTYVTAKRILRHDDHEGVELNFDAEVPQDPCCDIHRCERICVAFGPDDSAAPSILALRRTFPATPHQNATGTGEPKQLCLFADDYREVRSVLTAEMLLDRIADWLRRAALGKLHLPGQPLEPFLPPAFRIVFDSKTFDQPTLAGTQVLFPCNEAATLCRALRIPPGQTWPDGAPQYVLLPLEAAESDGVLISQWPASLAELGGLLGHAGVDLVEALSTGTRNVLDRDEHARLFGLRWALLLAIPRMREVGSASEYTEYWAALVSESIGELGVRLGVLDKHNGQYARLLGTQAIGSLDRVTVIPAAATPSLDRSLAVRMSGVEAAEPAMIAAIGAGALGSQVIMNLARQGVGKWTILDRDDLLPHNLARHALFADAVCQPKAEFLAQEIRALLGDAAAAEAVRLDVLDLAPDNAEYAKLLASPSRIYDFSASRAVARHLARLPHQTPVTSAFLTADERHLVVLVEGEGRFPRLDDLELQLCEAVTRDGRLADLFAPAKGNPVHYGGTCSDVTVTYAQDTMAAFAGIASAFLKQNLAGMDPHIRVWRLSPENLRVVPIQVEPQNVSVPQVDGWEVRVSDRAVGAMWRLRASRLPNETGGVLVGAIDVHSRVLYVAGALPAPPDSQEWPTCYIRGVRGLSKRVEQIREMTGEVLCYVGEWHSHPAGASAAPSGLDRKALRLLKERMSHDGLPALMAIQGDQVMPTLLVGQA